MKTIVVSGAQAKVGKTTLTLKLAEILPGAEVVKLGHGEKKPEVPNHFYPHGTPYSQILEKHGKGAWLIIESNSILQEIHPDLAIFLEGKDHKPSAQLAKEKADIISGQIVEADTVTGIGERLGLGKDLVKRIIWLAGGRPEPATLVILAGGKSSRMGQDKSKLKIGARTLLDHIQHDLGPYFDQVIISTGNNGIKAQGDAAVVKDLEPGRGPLMGIYSALSASRYRVNFIVACDLPDIHLPVVREVLSWSDTYDIILPSFEVGLVEPLLAVYTRDVLPAAQGLLARDKRKISFLFSKVRTHIIRIPDKDWYYNVNTPEEYEHFLSTRRAR